MKRRFSSALAGVVVGGMSAWLTFIQLDAKAACVDTSTSAATNCELFDSPSSNSFSINVFSGALNAASASGGSFQVELDGLNPGQSFSFTNLQLVLTGNSVSTVNISDDSFTANAVDDPSFFTIPQTFAGLGVGSITNAVLTGTFNVTSPVSGLNPTTFFAGVRFNSNGAATGNLLAVGASGGANRGENVLGSVYTQNEVPGPLPILGAGLAFGFSRRLRNRISAS